MDTLDLLRQRGFAQRYYDGITSIYSRLIAPPDLAPAFYRIDVAGGSSSIVPTADRWTVTIWHFARHGAEAEQVTIWSPACFPTLAAALDRAAAWAFLPLSNLRDMQAGAAARHAKPSPRDPLDELAPDLRAWLVDEMGMTPEMVGGGNYVLRHEGPAGWYIWVSGADSGMPSADGWHVGVYGPASEGEAVWSEAHDEFGQSRLTLRQAVAAACSIVAAGDDWRAEMGRELAAFCARAEPRLPLRSADDLLHEKLTPGQRLWISDFVRRFEERERAEAPAAPAVGEETPQDLAGDLANRLEMLTAAIAEELEERGVHNESPETRRQDRVARELFNSRALLRRIGVKLEG